MTTKKLKPTIRDIFRMPLVGGGRISPDGSKAIYGLGYVDNFEDNNLEVYAYLYNASTGKTCQFTAGNTVSQVRWVDSQVLALLKPASNTGMQIYVFDGLVGESQQITNHPGGVSTYEPFGGGFIYLAKNPINPRAERDAQFGSFIDVEEEVSRSALYYIDWKRILEYGSSRKHLRSDHAVPFEPIIELSKLMPAPYKIDSFVPSPSNDAVFLNCQSRDDAFYSEDTFCFRIEFDPESIFCRNENASSIGKITILALPKGAQVKAISPDGKKLLISHKEKGRGERIQDELWLLDATLPEETLTDPGLEKCLTCITRNFDQEPLTVYWTKRGIFASYWDRSTCRIARLGENGEVEVWDTHGLSLEYFHLNDDAWLFLRAASATTLAEIYIGAPRERGWDLRRITDFTEQYSDWDFGTAESITWTSKDGTEIEGILRKPSNFDPRKKYPLIFNIHGGPASASPLILLENNNRFFYPTVQLLNKDILILEPNYRGSLGRGQAFLSLNFDNLGTGDMWDLESAIEHLDAQGFLDRKKVGSMGWSQGGYISTFAAMHTTLLRAASAGAALSDWRIYYAGSDERRCILLSGNPYSNRETFDRAAPISAIDKAKTPILFQHGENDPRVPVISAMEMYRALKACGVETRLFIFSGQGHGFLKPRECYAVMLQNYRWFMHYLLGDSLDLFLDDSDKLSSQTN